MAIKISKSLQKNAFIDPTKETINKSVSQICNEVSTGQIIMPIFQRDLAWTTEKKIDLYNFQLNGSAPVSPISMNKIGPSSIDMPHVSLIKRAEVDNNIIQGKSSVIDGQQRISANYEAYTNSESIRKVVLDITRGIFVDLKEKDIKTNQIPVGVLYNQDPTVFTEYLRDKSLLSTYNVSSLLGQIRTKFFNYFYTVNTAHDLPGDEQIKWFDVLNLAGSRVPEIQMKLTRLQIKGLDFYKEYSNIFREKLELQGLEHLFVQKTTEVSIPLAALNPAFERALGKKHASNFSPIPSDAQKGILSEMDPTLLRECFKNTLKGLELTLDFINENELSNPSRIDYITYLTGYFVYNDIKELKIETNESLLEWYETVVFVNTSNKGRRDIFNNLLSIK